MIDIITLKVNGDCQPKDCSNKGTVRNAIIVDKGKPTEKIPIASPNSLLLNHLGIIAAVPIVKKQLPKPITTPPSSKVGKLVETAITKLPKEIHTKDKKPILRKPYLFIKNPAGIAIKSPGITMKEIRSPAVPAPTLNTDSILVNKGGSD